jgi:ABC-2 type transport system permease protein
MVSMPACDSTRASYIAFLARGIVVMTVMFNSAWSGMALIEDINRGVAARFLVSPVRREALVAGGSARRLWWS